MGPIMVEMKPIPGTIGFMVSNTGIVYDSLGNIRNQYTNLDGYKTASVKLINGKWQTFGVHRLVALAFLSHDIDSDLLTVNHIDHDIENNNVDNLEWVSVHINNIHAALMNKNNKYPKLILINNSGEKKFVKNLHEASELLELDIETCWHLIKNNVSFNGNVLQILKEIPLELKKKARPVFNEYGKIKKIELYLKDLETGVIEKYNSMKELSDKFNVSPSHIHQCVCYPGKISLFKRRYLISKKLEDIPNIDKKQYCELKSPTGKQSYLFDKNKNQILMYDSASEMIKLHGLSKKAVTTRLKNKGIGEISNYIFAYESKQKEFLNSVKISRSAV